MGVENIGQAEMTVALRDLATAELKRLNKSIKETGEEVSEVSKDSGNAFTSMLSDWRVQGLIAYEVLKKIGTTFKQMFRRGGDIRDMQAAFQSLGGDIGNFTAQVRRMVSDADLIRMSNMGSQANLTALEISKLGTAADILGDVLAMDTAEAFEAFTKAIMSGEAELLKQFGVTVQLTQDKLKNKKLLFDATIAAADKFKDANLSANDSEIQLNASVQNLTDSLAVLVNESKTYQNFFRDLAESIGIVNEQIQIQTGSINQMEIQRYQRQMRDLQEEIDDVSRALNNNLAIEAKAGASNRWRSNAIAEQREEIAKLEAEQAKLSRGIELITKTEEERLAVLSKTQAEEKKVRDAMAASAKAAKQYAKDLEKAKAAQISPLSKEDFASIFGDSRDWAESRKVMLEGILEADAEFDTQSQELWDAQRQWQIDRTNEVWAQQQAIADKAREAEEQAQRDHQQKMQAYWNIFGTAVVNTWGAMWEGIASGAGFDDLLKNFLGMLATMVMNLGNAILLSALALQAVPIFGLTGAGGVAAGAALIAFGGILKGLAGGIGGGSAQSSGKANFGGGSAFGTPTPDTGGGGVTNITVINSLGTYEDVLRNAADAQRGALGMGY